MPQIRDTLHTAIVQLRLNKTGLRDSVKSQIANVLEVALRLLASTAVTTSSIESDDSCWFIFRSPGAAGQLVARRCPPGRQQRGPGRTQDTECAAAGRGAARGPGWQTHLSGHQQPSAHTPHCHPLHRHIP